MCTAATYHTKDHYFGRNLDLEFSYGEEAIIIPHNFPFYFREIGLLNNHYAIMGIAHITDVPTDFLHQDQPKDYPLIYDAINEKGLGMAGLNFVGNAVYNDKVEGKDNIAQFEFLPWILSRCATVEEAKILLANINLLNISYSDQFHIADLHWILTDATGACIIIESVAEGLKIYDNPTGILTNNPQFPEQLFALNNYQGLSAASPTNTFAPGLKLNQYSRGMGGIGLPGDLSSQSRFVRAVFTKFNSKSADDELSSVNQFFHILHSVEQQNGCCDLGHDKFEYTIYSSCYNLEQGIFYHSTYGNHQLSAISFAKANLDSLNILRFPVITNEQVFYQN